ncbi:MAG: helix-turn-helix transcriptional regulator [Clostridiales bacterium]|nr:helix-turn-helix transcriptional regulator [Clostridiales bacterium]
MKFNENLKQLRTINGLGQKQLAEILNTTLKTVSHWETGYCEPSISQLITIANYFDVTIDELVGRIN